MPLIQDYLQHFIYLHWKLVIYNRSTYTITLSIPEAGFPRATIYASS